MPVYISNGTIFITDLEFAEINALKKCLQNETIKSSEELIC